MIVQADARHIPLADESVDCVVTSPPYWGLRDYGTAKWEGGDPECEHKKGNEAARSRGKSTIGYAESQGHNLESWGDACGKCGARRIDAQLGLEPTPDLYVAHLVEVFREVRRVLKPTGVCFLNLGDSYASATKGSGGTAKRHPNMGPKSQPVSAPVRCDHGVKDKDLVGIPWRVAFALQADGWWLRSDIIWHKRNCMPESVNDRPTKAHEYVFLLTKSVRYCYDGKAIAEPLAETTKTRASSGTWHNMEERPDVGFPGAANRNKAAINRDVRAKVLAGEELTRNARTVWDIPTVAYKGAHYATMAPKLAERCILAGCPVGGIVFDPFVGSGTTVAVALSLGRKGVGLDLSLKYLVDNAAPRIAKVQPVLEEVFA